VVVVVIMIVVVFVVGMSLVDWGNLSFDLFVFSWYDFIV